MPQDKNLQNFLESFLDGKEPEFYYQEKERKPYGYWTDFNNLRKELELIILELGRFPNRKDLEDLNRQDLVGGMNKHGGSNKIREKLGYEFSKKVSGHWNSKNIIDEAKKLVRKLGYLPTEDELKKSGNGGLSHAIQDKIGFQELRKRLGLDQHYAKKGIWMNEKYILKQARKAMKDNGWKELPPTNVLQKNRYSSLISAAGDYLGGVSELRRKLGQEQLTNKWKNKHFVLIKAKEILKKHKLKKFPSHGRLSKLGYSDIAVAIQRYHGGFTDFRVLLGEKNMFIKRGTWKDTRKCVEKISEIMEKHDLKEIPAESFFSDNGYTSFLSGIKRYQGGLPNFRLLIRKYQSIPSQTHDLELLLKNYIGENE